MQSLAYEEAELFQMCSCGMLRASKYVESYCSQEVSLIRKSAGYQEAWALICEAGDFPHEQSVLCRYGGLGGLFGLPSESQVLSFWPCLTLLESSLPSVLSELTFIQKKYLLFPHFLLSPVFCKVFLFSTPSPSNLSHSSALFQFSLLTYYMIW